MSRLKNWEKYKLTDLISSQELKTGVLAIKINCILENLYFLGNIRSAIAKQVRNSREDISKTVVMIRDLVGDDQAAFLRVREEVLEPAYRLLDSDDGKEIPLKLEILKEFKSPTKTELENFVFLHEDMIPKTIGHIIFDVDGTLMRGTSVSGEIRDTLSELLDKEVYINLVTGRNRNWMLEAFAFLKQHKNAKLIRVYCENGIGSMNVDGSDYEKIQGLDGHPIKSKEYLDLFSQICLKLSDVPEIGLTDVVPKTYYSAYDAEMVLRKIRKKTANIASSYYLSNLKEDQITLEAFRDPITKQPFLHAIQTQDAVIELIMVKLAEWELTDCIGISRVTTALNFLPIIDGILIDKAVASARALRRVASLSGVSLEKICAQTITIGDGKADAKLALPALTELAVPIKLPSFHVGPAEQFDPGQAYKSVIATSPTVFNSNLPWGEPVTLKILNFLKKRFTKLIV